MHTDYFLAKRNLWHHKKKKSTVVSPNCVRFQAVYLHLYKATRRLMKVIIWGKKVLHDDAHCVTNTQGNLLFFHNFQILFLSPPILLSSLPISNALISHIPSLYINPGCMIAEDEEFVQSFHLTCYYNILVDSRWQKHEPGDQTSPKKTAISLSLSDSSQMSEQW